VHKHRHALLCKFPDFCVALVKDRISSLSLSMVLLATCLVVFRLLDRFIKIIGICLPDQEVKILKTLELISIMFYHDQVQDFMTNENHLRFKKR
jgi:hypothetical protein